jgi:hypothetical protein
MQWSTLNIYVASRLDMKISMFPLIGRIICSILELWAPGSARADPRTKIGNPIRHLARGKAQIELEWRFEHQRQDLVDHIGSGDNLG